MNNAKGFARAGHLVLHITNHTGKGMAGTFVLGVELIEQADFLEFLRVNHTSVFVEWMATGVIS